nr:MAG TPA: hypothetical protein [Caudoviricetes sp.]
MTKRLQKSCVCRRVVLGAQNTLITTRYITPRQRGFFTPVGFRRPVLGCLPRLMAECATNKIPCTRREIRPPFVVRF